MVDASDDQALSTFRQGASPFSSTIPTCSENKRRWWVVSDRSEIDICPLNPGFEPDLYVTTELKTITRILMGDLSYPAAIRAGAIELDGKAELRRKFDMWLGRSHFAHIKDARQPARAKQRMTAAP